MREIVFNKLVDGKLVPMTDVELRQRKYKKYLDKETFDYYCIDGGYSRKEVAKLGIGSKTYINSYHFHYPSVEERKKIFSEKIRRRQIKNNSNKKNWGKPRKLLDKDKLEYYLMNGSRMIDLCRIFNVSEPTITANIKYYNIGVFVTGKIRGETVLALKTLERLSGDNWLDLFENGVRGIDRDKLRDYVKRAERELQFCKERLASIRHSYKLGASFIPRSRYERIAMQVLDDLGLDYVPQYYVENNKYAFDIYLPDKNIVIEIDGEGHNSETDKEKEIVAKNNGLVLLRIDVRNLKNKKKCFTEMKSKVLRALE